MRKKNYRRKQKRAQKLEQKINSIIYGPSYLELLTKVYNSSIMAQLALDQFLHSGRDFQKQVLYTWNRPNEFSCIFSTKLLDV